jgi:hypothetical protein
VQQQEMLTQKLETFVFTAVSQRLALLKRWPAFSVLLMLSRQVLTQMAA